MSAGRERIRVLLVEDDEEDYLITRDLLAEVQATSYELEWVTDYDAALAAIREARQDVCLVDYRFGVHNGLELAREALTIAQDTPIIMLTGRGDYFVDVEAAKLGIADYLVKGKLDSALLERSIRFAVHTQRTLRSLREAEERFRNAFDNAPIGVALVGAGARGARRFIDVNWLLCQITGYSKEELLRSTFDAITHADDRDADLAERERLAAGEIANYSVEKRCINAQGQVIWVLASFSFVRDQNGEPLYGILQVQDIGERKRFEEKLQHLADYDALTGLFNRRRFGEELDRQVAYNARYGAQGAVLVVDLDRFKDVNDTLGHALGDDLISRVAGLLRERLRDTDTLARLGGDEFAVLLPEADEAQAVELAGELLEKIREQGVVVGADRAMRVTASIGISLFAQEADLSGEGVLINADIAMYQAKENGRNRTQLLQTVEEPRARTRARLTWLERIREALAHDRFVLYQQPILDLRRQEITQHELLLRMVGSGGEVIAPGDFLPLAEQFGLIEEIDRWVIRRAVALVARRATAGHKLTVEVNLSGVSLSDEGLLELVEDELRAGSVDPTSLIFEVTETAAIVNIERAKRFARRLAELGCGFALDDFGAGFGSFYYLKHLPFDYLKIDGDFIRKLPENKADQLTVKAIVQIAQGLEKKTIAEFVGNQPTADLLRGCGVDFAQGHHIGKAVPVAETWPLSDPQPTPMAGRSAA